jgi:hypothetical protein
VDNVDFIKLDFLGIFQSFRQRAFTKNTIKHAWKDTGIVPYNPGVVLDPMRRKNGEELARGPRQRPSTPTTPTSSNIEDNPLNRTPRRPDSHHNYIEAIRKDVCEHGEIGKDYSYRQFFRFLRATNRQASTLALHTRDLDDATKAAATKAQRELYPQTVACSSEVMYVGEMRINYSERLTNAKQKTINNVNKLREAAAIAVRVATMHIEQGLANEDLKAAQQDVVSTAAAVDKGNQEVARYTQLEELVLTQIYEDKQRAEEEDRAYKACIEEGISQPPWSGDEEYISPYHPDIQTDFAPRYRLQKYRYKKPRVDPLAFLDDLDEDE